MEKTITIDGKDLKFKATGATPMVYKQTFGDDLLVDMARVSDKFKGGNEMPPGLLEKFGKIAYVMNKQAEPDQPDDWLEWLDQFEMFSIVEVLPEIIDLWTMNTKQTSKQKKSPAR